MYFSKKKSFDLKKYVLENQSNLNKFHWPQPLRTFFIVNYF